MSVPTQPPPMPVSPRQEQQNFFQKPTQDATKNQTQKHQNNKTDMFADFDPPKKQTPPPQQKPASVPPK